MNKKLSLSLFSTCMLLTIQQTKSVEYCCNRDYAYAKTHFSQRPQGNNQALVFIGTVDKTHLINNEENYLNFNVTLGYRQNFNNYDLGKYFFTERGPLNVGVANTDIDVQNLQLGLAQNFKGTACLLPEIHEFFADIDIFVGLDKWFQGFWGRLRLPFVHTEWNPFLNTSNNEVGTSVYPSGFASYPNSIINVEYRSLEDALYDGCRIGEIPAAEAGRINCNKKRYGLSDVHFEIGYDFFRRDHGNIGIALIGAIQTGQPTVHNCNQFLFSPSIGAQRSNQLGAALRCQYEIFNNSTENNKITFYSDLRTSYLFPGCNQRLLSLWANGTTAFNYWLMLNRYNSQGTYLGMERAANLLNKKVKVSAVMFEWTLMGQMQKNNWDISIGYNLWTRSQECLCMVDNALGNGADYYAIKYTNTDPTTNPPSTTASWGTYFLNKNTSDISTQSQNSEDRLTPTVDHLNNYAFLAGDIDVCVAQHPSTYSNMFFGSVVYNFSQTWLKPYLALAGQLEFGRGNTALSMWGVYVKGGISF